MSTKNKLKLSVELMVEHSIKITECSAKLDFCEKYTECSKCIKENFNIMRDKVIEAKPENIRVQNCDILMDKIGKNCSDFDNCKDCKEFLRKKIELTTAQLLKKIKNDKDKGIIYNWEDETTEEEGE